MVRDGLRTLWCATCLLGCSLNETPIVESDAGAAAGSGRDVAPAKPAAGSGGASAATKPAAATGAAGAASGSLASAGKSASPAGAAGASPTVPTSPTTSAGAAATAPVTGAAGRPSATPTSGSAAPAPSTSTQLEPFSFFVTSLEAMRELSGSQDGFGGDLRYGQSSGLAGADKICTEVAERSMPGAGAKSWHAFLSASAGGPNGGAVNARDRIGSGPWFDRLGRMVASDLSGLLDTRPHAAAAIADDLPNERGEPNRGTQDVDNHDTVTGSDAMGRYAGGSTCDDWTSTETESGRASGSNMGRGNGGDNNGPMCGHSWPAMSGQSWIAAHPAPGCAPSVSLTQNGAGSGEGIGNGGGYGGIYCFATMP